MILFFGFVFLFGLALADDKPADCAPGPLPTIVVPIDPQDDTREPDGTLLNDSVKG
ncbi:hypothetical protein [Hyphomicrobium sp. ghe19]|uniref:hypothetical protein n=1 Tax=Hyphomicrobium sp. ghe19 TaxID=2682968 RepID=UPI0030CE8CDC